MANRLGGRVVDKGIRPFAQEAEHCGQRRVGCPRLAMAPLEARVEQAERRSHLETHVISKCVISKCLRRSPPWKVHT